MAAAGGTDGGDYRLIVSEAVRSTIKKLSDEAKQTGHAAEFAATLRYIYERLTTDPSAFGEPLYTLKHLGLQMRHGGFASLIVNFAVDDERRLSYLTQCRRLALPSE
jgi:hypothetical protein